MKLSTVALITLIMITLGYVMRTGMAFGHLLSNPVTFVASSIGTWALMFFFFMLYRHSKDD
jgi:lipoprotein signal peptidase